MTVLFIRVIHIVVRPSVDLPFRPTFAQPSSGCAVRWRNLRATFFRVFFGGGTHRGGRKEGGDHQDPRHTFPPVGSVSSVASPPLELARAWTPVDPMAKAKAKTKAPASAAAVAMAGDEEQKPKVNKTLAVQFLKKMLLVDDDESASASSSSLDSEAELPMVKTAAVDKNEGVVETEPAPARRSLRRTRSSLKEEAEKLAKEKAKEKALSPKEKHAAKDRRRASGKSEGADKKRAKKKAPADKKEKRRRQVQSSDSEEEEVVDDKAKSEKVEAKAPLPVESRRKKPSSALKAAADKNEGVMAKKLKAKVVRETKLVVKKKSNGDAAPSKTAEKIPAENRTLVTPSPTRKRSRALVSSVSSTEAPPELTEEQKEKKARRLRRMTKLQKRRQVWNENQQAQKELRLAWEERDRATRGEHPEDEPVTGDLERESAKEAKRKTSEGVESGQGSEKDGERKVLPHKKRRKLSDSPADLKANGEVTRDAKQRRDEDDRTADNDAATTSQEDSTIINDDKAAEEDSEARKSKPSDEDPSYTAEASSEGTTKAQDEKVTSDEARKSASPIVADPIEAEEGQVHEDGGAKKPTEEEPKSEPEVAALADLPIPKKSSSQSDALADLPIPRRVPRPSDNATASFVIPKRSMKKLGIVGSSDGAQATTANGAGPVLLSSSRMVRKPRVSVPDILKAVVLSAPSALVRPARRRTKQQVPPEVTTFRPEEKEFIKSARRRRSLVTACLSIEEFARGPTPYEVFDTQGSLVPDLIPRLTCPTHRHLSTNRDEFPSSYFGVGLTSPKVNVKSIEEDDANAGATAPVATNCYEPLAFARPEDRESYQRKMYGTSFVPQLIKGRTTLIMRNARYERKSRGIRFNSDRDREDYAQVLSQRFKKNKSVPICEIPRESWRKMMVEQRAGHVYLHFYNREDAMLAALEFVDDNGIPLEWKREYRAGVVLTANVSPAAAPRRSRSSDRVATPAMSPEGSQYGSDRDRDRDFRNGRRHGDLRGPPPRERGRYGEPSIVQRSPSGIDYRTSFTTPTNNQSDRKRDRDADRPRRESRSRSRSRPRSRSRSHSIHAAASRDGLIDVRKRLSVENGEASDKAGWTGEDSRCESASNGNGNTGGSSKVSQDGAKSAESDEGGASSVERDLRTSGNADRPRDTNPANEEKPETEPGELPSDGEHSASNEKPTAREDEKRRDAYPSKRHQPDYNNGRRPNMDADEYHGASNGNSRQEPPHWRNDGRSHRGGRSRSRERPRNPEPRRDWERDERGPRPSMSRDYEPRRHGEYFENGGRGRDGGYPGNGYRDSRHEFPPLPPPPPPRDVRHHDRRRY